MRLDKLPTAWVEASQGQPTVSFSLSANPNNSTLPQKRVPPVTTARLRRLGTALTLPSIHCVCQRNTSQQWTAIRTPRSCLQHLENDHNHDSSLHT